MIIIKTRLDVILKISKLLSKRKNQEEVKNPKIKIIKKLIKLIFIILLIKYHVY